VEKVKSMDLIKQIEKLKRNKTIYNIINTRIKEFEHLGKSENNKLFQELSFCLMTANFNAERSIKIQNEIKNGFLALTQKQLENKLIKLGHRFPKTRAKYIFEARKFLPFLENVLESNEFDARDWLVKNIRGLGYKEASHFLRNCGKKNLAIIDFHIVDLLSENKLITKPKTKSLTRNKYLEIEKELQKLANKVNLNLSELDLYLWYIETGKILK